MKKLRSRSVGYLIFCSILLLTGCTTARAPGPYRYLFEYSNGANRTVDTDVKGEIQGCALVFEGSVDGQARVIFPFSWITRIIEFTDPAPPDPSRTKTLK